MRRRTVALAPPLYAYDYMRVSTHFSHKRIMRTQMHYRPFLCAYMRPFNIHYIRGNYVYYSILIL